MVAALQIIELTKYLYKEHQFQQALAAGVQPDPQSLAMDSFGNKETFIQGVGDHRIKSSVPLEPNPLCSSCRLSNIFYWETNFETVTLKQLVEKISELAHTEEYSVFLGSDIIFEKASYLEEDEIELYERKTSLKCRDFCATQQLKLTFDPEGGQKGSVFVKHNPQLGGEVVELWNVGNPADKTDFERFLIESNKKPKVNKPAPRAPIPLANLPETFDCLSESETSQIVDETIEHSAPGRNQMTPEGNQKPQVPSETKTFQIPTDKPLAIEDLDSPENEMIMETDKEAFAGSQQEHNQATSDLKHSLLREEHPEQSNSKGSVGRPETQKHTT